MACELARDFKVSFVESLGLRRPQLTIRDIKRIRSRLISQDSSKIEKSTPRKRPANLSIISPRVIPIHSGFAARFNRLVLTSATRDWQANPRSKRVLWTYSPLTYGLESQAKTVYHCVDLLASYPGINPKVIEEGEKNLARIGAVGIASSTEVFAHLQGTGFQRVISWPNVAEVDLFLNAGHHPRNPNLVVFGGNISPHKIDCLLIEELIRSLPEVEVVLAGPIAEGGGRSWPAINRLAGLGVQFVGNLSIRDLAQLFNKAAVGIIPYQINDYTRGVNPLKIYEYMAAGLPIVASRLPSLADDDEDVILTDSPHAFVSAVSAALGSLDQSNIDRRRNRARFHSWTHRGIEARHLVAQLLANSSG